METSVPPGPGRTAGRIGRTAMVQSHPWLTQDGYHPVCEIGRPVVDYSQLQSLESGVVPSDSTSGRDGLDREQHWTGTLLEFVP
jgi:hypothetical protein